LDIMRSLICLTPTTKIYVHNIEKSVHTLLEVHWVSIIKTNRLILFKRIITVYCERRVVQ
jgi:hypothetical protein